MVSIFVEKNKEKGLFWISFVNSKKFFVLTECFVFLFSLLIKSDASGGNQCCRLTEIFGFRLTGPKTEDSGFNRKRKGPVFRFG